MPTVYTIEEYLRGLVAIDVTDAALMSLLTDAGVEAGTALASLSLKQKDLLKANLYVWCASSPQGSCSVEDANGVWKHRESTAAISESDRRNWLRLANSIFTKYGMNTVGTNGIKLHSRGMGLWSRANRV